MSFRRSLIEIFPRILAILVLVPSVSAASPSKVCGTRIDFKIASRNIALLTCDSGLRGLEADAALYDVSGRDDDPTAPAVRIPGTVSIRLIPHTQLKYSEVRLPCDLDADKSYVLKILPGDIKRVLPDDLRPGPEGWAPISVSFNTKPTALLTNTKDPLELGAKFFLSSDIGLQTCAAQKPSIQEMRAFLNPRPYRAILQRSSLNLPNETDTATASCQPPVVDPQTAQPQFNPPHVGQAFLRMRDNRFYQATAHLNVKGVYDIFGKEVSIPKDSQKLILKELPKAKDDATYYLQFSNQAGPGSKPTWALDTKAAPVFGGEFSGFSPTLNVVADVGFGGTESPNTITLGGGLTRLFFTRNRTIQAVRFSPSLNFETDRTFDRERNLILSPDFRLYLPFLNNKRDLRSRRAYLEKIDMQPQSEITKIDSDDPAFKKYWGFFTQFWLGIETGGTLISPTVQTQDRSSFVVVPSYGVLRFHPRIQTNFELWRFTLDLSATSRYVGITEYVGRVIPITNPTTGARRNIASLYSIQGWRGYGELSLCFALDRSTHINFATTYKYGSAPPTFDTVNVVQSGITLKY